MPDDSPSPAPSPPAPGDSLARDYEHCLRLAASHYENFPTAARLLPRAMRAPVAAIYAYARGADDLADEGEASTCERLRALGEQERALGEALAGSPRGPVFRALADTVRRFGLPASLLADLLSAFRQDVLVNRYATFEDLRRYTRRSADPVGRLVLRLAGLRDRDLDRLSDGLCTGLQLANFWQDLSVDRARGRLYLPLEDLERFGCEPGSILAGRPPERGFAGLLALQGERTRALLDRGALLAPRVGGRLGFWLRWVRRGGRAILARSLSLGPRLLRERPALGPPGRLATALGALADGVRGR
jgi:squalene synthase HpnC